MGGRSGLRCETNSWCSLSRKMSRLRRLKPNSWCLVVVDQGRRRRALRVEREHTIAERVSKCYVVALEIRFKVSIVQPFRIHVSWPVHLSSWCVDAIDFTNTLIIGRWNLPRLSHPCILRWPMFVPRLRSHSLVRFTQFHALDRSFPQCFLTSPPVPSDRESDDNHPEY